MSEALSVAASSPIAQTVSRVDTTDLDVFSNPFSYTVFKEKYSWDGRETWAETARRVVHHVCGDLIGSREKSDLERLIRERKFIPGGRYLYAAGREYHNYNNCFLLRAEDSREGWSELLYKSAMCLMSGGGIGVDYSDVRPRGAEVKRTGGVATGPCSLMHMVNETGRGIVNGGNRRSAIWAGLSWGHADINEFLNLKNHAPELRAQKERDFTFPLPMELTNVSVIYDKAFFDAQASGDARACDVWMKNCRQAFSTAEPGFAFNYKNARESLKNACTEVVSEDDSDKCNLGTLWLNRFESLYEFERAIPLATLFLLCGGITSHVPTDKVREVGTRNNRIGLGIGGLHEWLMMRGCDYEVTPEMHKWLRAYRDISDDSAQFLATKVLGVAEPKGKRAIAPNGTIGLVAETTTGIEPLFCAAYLRRYYKDGKWWAQYVIDGAVKRLLERGVPLGVIERNDAYALGFEQRVAFQADVQDYVDMAISSTCNMAAWGSMENCEDNVEEKARVLLSYGPRLRGFTCYPDGCRGGQPLTKVSVKKAREMEGVIVEEQIRECTNGVCGLTQNLDPRDATILSVLLHSSPEGPNYEKLKSKLSNAGREFFDVIRASAARRHGPPPASGSGCE